MISKNRLKYLRSLKIKKYRIKEQLLLVEGFRLISEALNAQADIQTIYYSKKILNNKEFQRLFDKCNSKKIEIVEIQQKNIDELSDSINNQGIIAIINTPISIDNFTSSNQLILDSISDPGNMGNILRTADWFGLKNIYLSENSIDPYNRKTVRASMGAHFYINIIFINIDQHIKMLKENNFTIIGADVIGDNLYDWEPPSKWAIILGNEAHGISSKVKELVDYNITIPKKGNIESLNVAMAAGILLSHAK